MAQRTVVFGLVGLAILLVFGGLIGSSMGLLDIGGVQGIQESNEGNFDDRKAISFVVFCNETTTPSPSGIDINVAVNKSDDPHEPVSLNWLSDTKIDYVVAKAGTTIQNHDPDPSGISGTVISGEGTSVSQDQADNNPPCRTGDVGVKFEFDKSQDKFVHAP